MLLLLSLSLCLILLMMLPLFLMMIIFLVTILKLETKTPATYIPTCKTFGYPDLDELKEMILDDGYITLDDDLCRELRECVDSNPDVVKELLEKHSMKNKIIPDPKFSTF